MWKRSDNGGRTKAEGTLGVQIEGRTAEEGEVKVRVNNLRYCRDLKYMNFIFIFCVP